MHSGPLAVLPCKWRDALKAVMVSYQCPLLQSSAAARDGPHRSSVFNPLHTSHCAVLTQAHFDE